MPMLAMSITACRQILNVFVSKWTIFWLLRNRYILANRLQVKAHTGYLLPKRTLGTEQVHTVPEISTDSRQATLFRSLTGIPRMFSVGRSSSKTFLNIWEFITFMVLLRNCFAFPGDITSFFKDYQELMAAFVFLESFLFVYLILTVWVWPYTSLSTLSCSWPFFFCETIYIFFFSIRGDRREIVAEIPS